MKIIISPAKSLDFEKKVPVDMSTKIQFSQQAQFLNTELKKKSVEELKKLMSISNKLAQLNFERNQQWNYPFDKEKSKQAIFAFTGDVYRGINIQEFTNYDLDFCNENLRILSGLYGLLKPLDLILPYRLEMGIKIKVGDFKNLYTFWKNHLAKELNNQMEDYEILVNLASDEYFKAIDKKVLNAKVITPIFKDYKDDKLKVVSSYVKKARGIMVNFIIKNKINNPHDLKNFNMENYHFDENLSDDKTFIFTR